MLIRASTGGTRPPTQVVTLLRCLIYLFREYFCQVLKMLISKQIYFADYAERIVNARVAKRQVLDSINTIDLKCPIAVAEVWMSADLDRLVPIQIVAVNMFEEMCDSVVVAILSDFLSRVLNRWIRWTVENEMTGEDQQVEWVGFGWFDLFFYLFI